MDGSTTRTMEAECCNITLNRLESSIGESNISTLLKSSYNSVEERFEVLVAINVLVLIVSILSILNIGFALRILAMCKKTPLQIRYLSVNLLVCFMIFETSVSLHTLAMLMFGDMHYMFIFNSRIFCSTVFVTTIWSSLCAISVDRVLALTMPFNHAKYATKLVLKIVVIILWILNIVVPTTTILITIAIVCGQHSYITTCDTFAIFRPTGLGLTGLLSCYAVLIVMSCIKILRIAFYHKRCAEQFTVNQTYLSDLIKSQKYSKSTRTVLTVIIAFIVFQSPVFLHLTVLEYMPQLQTQYWRLIFQALDYIGHQMNIYASLYIYIWKFKECRMHFYFILSRLNRKYFEAANALRIEIYDIVLKERATNE